MRDLYYLFMQKDHILFLSNLSVKFQANAELIQNKAGVRIIFEMRDFFQYTK